jgi:tRNA-splicing endonuclease subunit Sen34
LTQVEEILQEKHQGTTATAVYRHLWNKGYFLSPGMQFGGDLICYAGDPQRYHSLAVITLTDYTQPFMALDFVGFGRLAHGVNKTHILVAIHPDQMELEAGDNPKLTFATIDWDSQLSTMQF